MSTDFYLPDECWESVYKFLIDADTDADNNRHYLKKRKRTSLKSSQQLVSSTKTTIATDFYLPDEYWECIFKFLIDDGDNNSRYLKTLSLVSKQFLSITNRLRFSLTLYHPTRYLKKFTNLTYLDLTCFYGDLNKILLKISRFQLKLKSLNLSNQFTIPQNGLRIFSQNIKTLTSLICSNMNSINSTDLFLIADCFPFLEELDLSNPSNFKDDDSDCLHGVEILSSTLLQLRNINLSSHNYINNQSLLQLFKNCEFLEEVTMLNCRNCNGATIDIASVLGERRYFIFKLYLGDGIFKAIIDRDYGSSSNS